MCKRSDTERGELPASTNLIASNFSSNVLLRIWTVRVVSNFVGSLQSVSPVPPNKLKYLQHKNNTHSTYYSILSSFYIKPQLARWSHLCVAIVSYRLSTSNHNLYSFKASSFSLYLIVFLHQTTTSFNTTAGFRKLYLIVFLHQTTTCILSRYPLQHCILSSFYIKPQHKAPRRFPLAYCILSSFYIKPQPRNVNEWMTTNCILSSFYIKPQR